MKKLWRKFVDYYRNASWGRRISDLLFYAFLVALLIPSSRNWLIVHGQRLVMWAPSEKKQQLPLSQADWQLTVVDAQGKQCQLQDFQGKVIFINFWATWCAPCLAEMPALQQLYDHFRNDTSVVFLFITDENVAKAQQFLKQKGFDLPVYQYFYPPVGQLRHRSIPSSYLIDKRGRIVMEAHRSKRWNSRRTIRYIERLARQ